MITKIVIFICISLSIYLAIAITLTILPVKREVVAESLDFDGLEITEESSTKEQYLARDGNKLFFRFFPSNSNTLLILLHGSGTEGRYLAGLGQRLSLADKAKVVIPDLRGHGQSVATASGDVSYLGQLEDDLFDLTEHLRNRHPNSILILGGHSSGGGLAVKHGGKNEDLPFAGYLFLAPYLGHDAPTTRPNSGDWVQVSVRRYIGLSMLNNIGITLFNDTPVLFFNRPEQWDDELQVDSYSYRMNESFSPQDYARYLGQNKKPILTIMGLEDEALYAKKYKPVFSELAPHANVQIIEGVHHLNLPDSIETYNLISKWLNQFNS